MKLGECVVHKTAAARVCCPQVWDDGDGLLDVAAGLLLPLARAVRQHPLRGQRAACRAHCSHAVTARNTYNLCVLSFGLEIPKVF